MFCNILKWFIRAPSLLMIFKCKKCWPWSTFCLLKQCFLLPLSQYNEYSGPSIRYFLMDLIMNWFSFILCTCYSQDWMTQMGERVSKSKRIHIWLFRRIREMVITLNSYIMNSLSIITQCQPVTFLKSMRRTRLYIRPSTRSSIHTNNNIPIHINTIYQTFELLLVFTYTHWLTGVLWFFRFILRFPIWRKRHAVKLNTRISLLHSTSFGYILFVVDVDCITL